MEAELLRLREQVLIARRDRTPLRLRGAGTKDFYSASNSQSTPCTTVDLRPFSGILDYEPSELVITARCGTPLSQIEAALAERGQFLGFEPPGFGADPTLGGIVAAGLSGPRRLSAGAVRDFVLGAALLAGDGELLQFGGRVMKNVAGFDVARLLCGSLGIFGIITQVCIKVLPRPRAEATVQLEMKAGEAIEAFNRWGSRPLPVSGAAWYDGGARIRFSGAVPAVEKACTQIGGKRLDAAAAQRWWDSLRHYTHPLFSSDSLWRLSLPQTAAPLDLSGDPLIDWGGALRWYAGDQGERDVRELAQRAAGTAMRWRGPAATGRFHPLSPAVAEIHRRLKRAFDPEGIFNPGRLLADL
ncbi:MAG TPA: glycolate oxidase subunit GlcE [Steroidobacteraceae bacterium]|nr:glycolate oxidase subunit GlcE [Steroidobacteraceae bacterium]